MNLQTVLFHSKAPSVRFGANNEDDDADYVYCTNAEEAKKKDPEKIRQTQVLDAFDQVFANVTAPPEAKATLRGFFEELTNQLSTLKRLQRKTEY